MANCRESLVSVIVPCFQQERFIAETLESLQSQTYPNWECIVVDDGSTDGSRGMIKYFVSKDSRIRYLYQENEGVSAARNAGFMRAKGEFINFLDGDDWLRPDKLRRQVEFLNQNPDVDWCYCDHVHRYEEKGIEEHYDRRQLGAKPLEDFLFHWDRGLSIPLHCGMFRRAIWHADELPFAPDYAARWEDWIFWINLCLLGCKPAFIPYQDAVYRMHSANFSRGATVAAENTLRAAFYVAPRIPSRLRDQFLRLTIASVLVRHYELQRQSSRQRSLLWKVAGRLTRPFRVFLGRKLSERLKAYLFE